MEENIFNKSNTLEYLDKDNNQQIVNYLKSPIEINNFNINNLNKKLKYDDFQSINKLTETKTINLTSYSHNKSKIEFSDSDLIRNKLSQYLLCNVCELNKVLFFFNFSIKDINNEEYFNSNISLVSFILNLIVARKNKNIKFNKLNLADDNQSEYSYNNFTINNETNANIQNNKKDLNNLSRYKSVLILKMLRILDYKKLVYFYCLSMNKDYSSNIINNYFVYNDSKLYFYDLLRSIKNNYFFNYNTNIDKSRYKTCNIVLNRLFNKTITNLDNKNNMHLKSKYNKLLNVLLKVHLFNKTNTYIKESLFSFNKEILNHNENYLFNKLNSNNKDYNDNSWRLPKYCNSKFNIVSKTKINYNKNKRNNYLEISNLNNVKERFFVYKNYNDFSHYVKSFNNKRIVELETYNKIISDKFINKNIIKIIKPTYFKELYWNFFIYFVLAFNLIYLPCLLLNKNSTVYSLIYYDYIDTSITFILFIDFILNIYFVIVKDIYQSNELNNIYCYLVCFISIFPYSLIINMINSNVFNKKLIYSLYSIRIIKLYFVIYNKLLTLNDQIKNHIQNYIEILLNLECFKIFSLFLIFSIICFWIGTVNYLFFLDGLFNIKFNSKTNNNNNNINTELYSALEEINYIEILNKNYDLSYIINSLEVGITIIINQSLKYKEFYNQSFVIISYLSGQLLFSIVFTYVSLFLENYFDKLSINEIFNNIEEGFNIITSQLANVSYSVENNNQSIKNKTYNSRKTFSVLDKKYLVYDNKEDFQACLNKDINILKRQFKYYYNYLWTYKKYLFKLHNIKNVNLPSSFINENNAYLDKYKDSSALNNLELNNVLKQKILIETCKPIILKLKHIFIDNDIDDVLLGNLLLKLKYICSIPKEIIFQTGNPCEGLYILEKGTITLISSIKKCILNITNKRKTNINSKDISITYPLKNLQDYFNNNNNNNTYNNINTNTFKTKSQNRNSLINSNKQAYKNSIYSSTINKRRSFYFNNSQINKSILNNNKLYSEKIKQKQSCLNSIKGEIIFDLISYFIKTKRHWSNCISNSFSEYYFLNNKTCSDVLFKNKNIYNSYLNKAKLIQDYYSLFEYKPLFDLLSIPTYYNYKYNNYKIFNKNNIWESML